MNLVVLTTLAVLAAAPMDQAALVRGHPHALEADLFTGPAAMADSLVLDVRERPEPPIPGALALPLYSLRSKRFLQGRKVLLVNEGYGFDDVAQECRRLRREGVPDAAVLAWRRDGPREIPARAFYRDKDLDNVLVVALAGRGERKTFSLVPGALVLPAASGLKRLVATVADAVKLRHVPVLYVLVLATEPGLDQRVAAELDRALDVPVVRLEGGWPAWTSFLDAQLTVWRGGRRVSASGCATCR